MSQKISALSDEDIFGQLPELVRRILKVLFSQTGERSNVTTASLPLCSPPTSIIAAFIKRFLTFALFPQKHLFLSTILSYHRPRLCISTFADLSPTQWHSLQSAILFPKPSGDDCDSISFVVLRSRERIFDLLALQPPVFRFLGLTFFTASFLLQL